MWVRFSYAVAGLFLILGSYSLALGGEPTTKSAKLRNETEDVIFPSNDMAIIVNYAGRVNLTAKMQAFTLPSLEEVWYKEIPLGKAEHRWPASIWLDESGITLCVGNGPLCAVDVKSGEILWSVKYDDVGIVQDVLIGDKTLLVMGTKKKGLKGIAKGDYNTIVYETVKNHLQDPKIACLDRVDGKKLWEFEYEPTKPYDLSSCFFSDSAGDFADGHIYIKGKYLYCLSGKDGTLVWKSKEKAEGTPTLENGVLYANLKEYLVALKPETGSQIWKSSEKLDEHSRLIGWYADKNMILLVPGKEKDNSFEGGYKVYCVDSENGKLVWKFDKGKELCSNRLYENEIVLTDKEKFWILDPSTGKVLAEDKNEKGYNIGLQLLQDGSYLVCGSKGIRCYESYKSKKGGKLLWKYEASLAEHGGGFLSGFVDAMMKIATGEVFLRSVGIKNKAGYRDGMFRSIDHSTILSGDRFIIFPTRDKGVQGISLTDGSLVWTSDVKKDPFLYTIFPSSWFIAATKDFVYYIVLK